MTYMPFSSVFFDETASCIAQPDQVAEGFRVLGDARAVSAYGTIVRIAEACRDVGGRALMVGGSVRDMLLGRVPNDFDVEIYGIPPEDVEKLMREFGEVSDVGKAFAILKIVVDEIDIDVAVPRKERKVGEGHGGFDVEANPHLNPREAARRRDFTVNAIAADPLTGEIVDPFDGMRDLAGGILRVVDSVTFVEDPLRVLRAMQLTARYALTVDAASFDVMRVMVPMLREISEERIGDEWRKLLLKSEKPSIGLAFGMQVGAFALLHPELAKLTETPQEPEWHPEGDVWTHTMLVVDEAVKIIRREHLDSDRAFTVLLGALCHDLGKPYVTHVEHGRIRSHGHEDAGVAPTRVFLEAISVRRSTIEEVVGIVRDHMKPYRLWHAERVEGKTVSDGVLRRLASRIFPAILCDLVLVTEADFCGRGPFPDPSDPSKKIWDIEYPAGQWLLERARPLELLGGPGPHAITGDELIGLGYPPGSLFGQIIQLCDDLRDDDGHCHYHCIDTLKDVPMDAFGGRDTRAAIARLQQELG